MNNESKLAANMKLVEGYMCPFWNGKREKATSIFRGCKLREKKKDKIKLLLVRLPNSITIQFVDILFS